VFAPNEKDMNRRNFLKSLAASFLAIKTGFTFFKFSGFNAAKATSGAVKWNLEWAPVKFEDNELSAVLDTGPSSIMIWWYENDHSAVGSYDQAMLHQRIHQDKIRKHFG
jgi:hypothetical protein